MRRFVVCLSLAAIAGCSSSPSRDAQAPKELRLRPGAEMVEVTSFVSADRLVDYEEVRTSQCSLGMNYATAEVNVAACEAFFRNEAFNCSASIAWVKSEWKRVGTSPDCANCVEMRALLLTPRTAPEKRASRKR